jgi:lysophospholipase L1-like esterase
VRLPEGRRANLTLAAASALATLVVAAFAWEIRGCVRYHRWRARFDEKGWMGRLTVASANPVLLWEYRPHAEVDGIATNRFGFREVDLASPEKPPGTYRIAFVGDSVTLGMGVAPAQTFVRRVGEASFVDGGTVQALNFGVDGYQALQVRELLTTKVLAFQPDQVVYMMCLNDFDFADSSGRKISYFRKPSSFVLLDLERAFRALRGTEFHRHHFARNRTEVFGAVVHMKRVLDERGADFLMVVVPAFPERAGDRDHFAHYDLADLHEEIARFADQNGVPLHDLLPAFRALPPPAERYALDLWHLSEEGHRAVADNLRPVLLRSNPTE